MAAGLIPQEHTQMLRTSEAMILTRLSSPYAKSFLELEGGFSNPFDKKVSSSR
jgi:hypothetical protein